MTPSRQSSIHIYPVTSKNSNNTSAYCNNCRFCFLYISVKKERPPFFRGILIDAYALIPTPALDLKPSLIATKTSRPRAAH